VFSDPSRTDWPEAVQHLIEARRTTLPKRLVVPGPNAPQQQALFAAAAAAPDHGQLQPWRLVIVPDAQRPALADVFAQALQERDAQATPDELAQARDKAYRAPLLLLVVVDAEKGDPTVDVHERGVAAGCAIQNMLLLATAMGFGSALTSGKALKSLVLRALFGLSPSEFAPCFVSVGTVGSRPKAKPRFAPHTFVTTLGAPDRASTQPL